MYCAIIKHFAHPRVRLELGPRHPFEFLVTFHNTFVYARICESQNVVHVWTIGDIHLRQYLLQRKSADFGNSYSGISTLIV